MTHRALRAYQNVVDISEIPEDDLRDVLGRVLEHLGLEIVQEATPDYTEYELRQKPGR